MCKTVKMVGLLFVVLLAVAIFAGEASAYTAPYRLVVFTDKQVYLDFGYQVDTLAKDTAYQDNSKGSFNQRPNVFVSLLDSDGNIVKGIPSANFSARLKDVERWNHSGPGLESYPFYTVIATNGAYYNNLAFPSFADSDGDGIFNSTNDVTDFTELGSMPPITDHLNISINVTVNYLGVNYAKNVSVVFGAAGCYHVSKTITSAHAKSAHDDVPCTVCHWGYQYALGSHGPNNSVMYNDPARLTGIPLWSSIGAYDYKLGYIKTGGNQTTWDNSNASFCVLCHSGPDNAPILDLGVGSAPASTDQNADGLNDNTRPSCSWYQGPNASGAPYPVCHGPQAGSNGSTKTAQTQLFNIDWKGWSQTPGQSKSHNHSSGTKGPPCEICHAGGGAPGTGTGGLHQVAGLPNTTTDYSNINDQCVACHNITGGLNITANGGTNVAHDGKTNCKNCHIDNNKLDTHLVPVGAFGGMWCLDCHNLTGKSPTNMKVDPAIVNVSNPNYTHYKLNKNSDATNSSIICWGCHTNNSYVINGRVNSTSLSPSEHPTGYDTPRNCTLCHYNTSVYNFSAPQNARHTWYAPDMKTPAVTSCTDCHATNEMLNTWTDSVYPPKNDSEAASHYGRNRTSFFEPLVGTRAYCGYCHQNESTVMGPFANDDNEVRSDHASQTTTPGCGNNTCHKPGRMHDDTLVVPVYNESNIASTCLACHSASNYSNHNSTLTCWDCHMGNVSNTSATWIHPIQFIQYNGNFTGAKLTGATCYDCHKSTSVDNTTLNLSGKKAPKVNNQAHSNDPNNGTKWGDYWKYTPTTYEFASYYVGSGDITPVYPFDNIKVPSNDYMELTENQTGSSNDPVTFPYTEAEREINGPPVPNWTSSTAMSGNTAGSVATAVQDGTKGNPAGSLKASFTTGSGAGTIYGYVWWNYSFYYNPDTSQYSYTNASVNYNITVPSGNALTQAVYLRIVKPSGAVVTLASASSTTDTGWLTLSNNSFASALNENGSVTPYKLQLYTEFQGVKTSKVYTAWYDNILLGFQEKVWNKYDIVINTTGVPVNGSSKLGMSYQVHKENTSLQIYNKTSQAYELLDTLDKGVFFDYVKDINSTHHVNSSNGITGNVSLRFVDTNQNDTDAVSDKLHIRYLYIYTDRGLQYPCEQCHSPNKHYLNPSIGSPDTFKGSNIYNNTNLSNSTWCQQCHWQGASNYSGMIMEFNVTRNPPENIPPEITGNATYAPLAKPGYVNHTGSAYSNMNDSGCFSCHGKSGDTTSSQFVHNVQVGTSGNRQCITCHNATTTQYKKVDVEAVRKGMHANLKNASANVSNTSNSIELTCWACHGDGTYNSSDQHRNSNAWTCDKCHTNTTGKLSYSATKVYEHIPAGFITPEANITANSTASWSCAGCHNNSINTTALVNDNEADSTNARTGHYGLNRTSGKLMYDYSAPPKGNSEDCIYCHKGNNANMTKWGINTSTSKNLSNKASHGSYTNSQCGGCHNYTDSAAFTFHAVEINEGAGSGPDCKSCHDTSVSGTDKGHINYTAFNASIHGGINTTSGANNNPDNEPCWACHGSGQSEGHNTTGDAYGKGNYTNPYVCADCHVSTGVRYAWATSKGAINVSEHFTNGTDIRASYNSTASFSCLKCHQDIGEMLLYNNDTDYNKTAWALGGDKYNGTIGGNNSPYHYGVKRPSLNGSASDTDGYCNYCHNNASSAFPYVSQHNKSIFEHTNTTNTSVDIRNNTLTCANSICHSTGRIHNSTLNKPAQTNWTSGKYDYCAPCHKSTGNANKKVYNQWHDPINSSSDNITNCNYCHDSGSLGSTTLNYNLNVHSDNLTYPANAVNCTACHNVSSTYVKSRKILTHFPNASKDKGDTSLSARTCEACHGIAGQSMHASGLVKKPAYTCTDCHVSTAAGPYWANQSFNSYIDTTSHDNSTTSNLTNCVWCHNNTNRVEPFHFTSYANGSAANPGWGGWQAGKPVNCTDCHDSAYSNQAPFYAPAKPHAGTGNNTDECYSCHTSVNTYAAAPLAVHTVIQSPGNANCTKCHDMGGAASKEVDVAGMNKTNSIHVNLNSGAANSNATAPYATDSKRCWACHGDGSDKNEHDPARYKAPYKCEDCHTTSGSMSGKYPSFNVTEHFASGGEIKTANASYCYTCHNKGEMLQGHNDTDVLSSNASVGHYGKKRGTEMRSGANTTCTYCHQNSTTAFESAMLRSSNKSILEHTDSGTRNTTGRACTDSACHSQGFIHNATLTKPSVQVWTSGKNDYCAPCHKSGNASATKYVYGHNSSNMTVISTDCGYCHNSSSQGQISTGGLKLHASTLTNKSTTNSTCVSCHRDDAYVTSQRAINTHYPGAPQGKANTSLDSFTCEACHGNMAANKMHAPVNIPADRCNNCHNGTASGTYKATKIPYVNSTKHDNASHNVSNNINCEWCHNNTNAIQKFHFTQYPNGSVQAPGWNGWSNGTNANCTNCHDTYNQTKPFYAEPVWHKGNYGTTPDNCYQCHTNVSSSTGSFAPIALHNVTKVLNWSYCNNCHSNNYGGAPVVDNSSLASSMHFSLNGSTPSNTEPACKACHGGNATTHRNASANDCTYCHITGSTKYSAKNVSRHIPYPLTINVNTSRYQNVFCSDCHNNSLRTFSDPTPSSGNATTSHYGMNKTAGKLMYNTSGNSEDCIYCHRNSSNMAAWGILSTGNANLSKKGSNHATASNSDCYTCHVNSTTTPATFHVEDISAGAGGGPDCKACHDIGGNAQGKLVNFSAMNAADAVHKNLNSGASDTTSSPENRACWACHTRNGTQPQAGNHTLVDRYKAPYNCTDCHISKAGQNFNYTPKAVLNVTQHKADTVNGTTIFTPLAQDCYSCHNRSEMMAQANDPDSGTGAVYGGLHGGSDSVSHYGLKRSDLGGYSQNTDGYCNYCHNNASSPFYLSDANKSIIEHTTNTSANISNVSTLRCVDCHRTGRIHNASLNKTLQSAWTSGQQDFCAPCHKPKPTGSANKSVYQQGHDPVNSSSDRIGDCGFCHNASSQGVNGSYLNVHSETLTNRSTTVNSSTCQGCHNGTSIYTGSAKQILSHMPNASQYRGNTSTSSYTCEACHNMSNKPSMHSAGMNRSNGTCDSCHLNNTSPFKSLTKSITQLAGMLNHSYNGSSYTNCTMCHNASGAAKGYHLDQYAASIIADPERINSVWSNRNLYGFSDTPYVDCIDCHEKFNDTAPFNAPFFEANKTGINNQEHVGKGYTINNCFVCHTNEDNVSKRVTVHNVSIEPLSGGPNCKKCHDIASPNRTGDSKMWVNFTAFNSTNSTHRNLSNVTAWGGSALFTLIDTACWACHQSDGKQMERHPDLKDDTTITGGYKAYRCADCHTVGGNVSGKQPKIYQNATKIYKHYPGAVFSGNKVFTSAINCSMCHKNSKVADINLSAYSDNIDAMATNSSHYATRTDLIDTRNSTATYGCTECHETGDTRTKYGNATLINSNHNTMGGSPARCQKSCHNSNPSFNITLHSANLGINIGTSGCYSSGCHTAPSSGGRRKR